MAQVEITVNDRTYKVTCDDGQEGRLQQLAGYFDRYVKQLSQELGQIGDARLMLLSALTVCDELFESRRRISDLEEGSTALDADTIGGASRVIEAAAKRVDLMADKASRA